MTARVYYDEVVQFNDVHLGHDVVRIGFCPDWKVEPDGRMSLPHFTYWTFNESFRRAGVKMHILSYTEKIESLKVELDGWLIPGGRDLDPKYYGQENNGSVVTPGDAELRWNFCRHWIDHVPEKMPVLGICYGLQVLNCLFGGTLIQDLPCAIHHTRKRKIHVEQNSWLQQALKGESRVIGNCNHHQGLDQIPECFTVVAKDDHDQLPHSLQYNKGDREIFAILWHPEYTYRDTRYDEIDYYNQGILEYFFARCSHFKTERQRHRGEPGYAIRGISHDNTAMTVVLPIEGNKDKANCEPKVHDTTTKSDDTPPPKPGCDC